MNQIKKSDVVREAVKSEDWKKALKIAKDFRLNITNEQRAKMSRAYECIVHPEFYMQIGIDVDSVIESGVEVINSLYGA